MGVLVPQCMNMLVTGSPRQGKEAVRCLAMNMKESARNHFFGGMVGALKGNLDPSNCNYRTAIVALGHIALLMPEQFKKEMKGIICKKVKV
jgi:sister-chromatid-cohesion protein PDS5